MTEEEMVTITAAEYHELLRLAKILSRLEAAGVDNCR